MASRETPLACAPRPRLPGRRRSASDAEQARARRSGRILGDDHEKTASRDSLRPSRTHPLTCGFPNPAGQGRDQGLIREEESMGLTSSGAGHPRSTGPSFRTAQPSSRANARGSPRRRLGCQSRVQRLVWLGALIDAKSSRRRSATVSSSTAVPCSAIASVRAGSQGATVRRPTAGPWAVRVSASP